jgi:ferredoxin-type protein NapG
MTPWLAKLFAVDDRPKKREERRRVLRSAAFASLVVAVALLGYVPIVRRWRERLRPPGAIDEHEFLSACIKCGQCLQVCPVQAIRLGDLSEGYGLGAPYIVAREQACDFSCDAVQCVLACPTGALSHDLSKKEEARMGVARLTNPDACLARQGAGFRGAARGTAFAGRHRYMEVDRWKPIRIADHPYDLALCDLCVRECPIEGAISLEPLGTAPNDKRRTPVVHKACVGCGMCEMICPADPSAISVDIRAVWREQGRA